MEIDKVCKTCKSLKTINDFRSKRNICRKCENLKQCEYRKNNLDKVREIKKVWREANKDKENERNRKWKEKVKNDEILHSEMKSKRNEYLKNKRKTDTNFRMKEAMRRMLRRTLLFKTDRTSALLGYTALELKQHLETLFIDNMSWENYGVPTDGIYEPKKTWSIDHVKPIDAFPKNTHPSIINALNNLQPMWWEENSSKRHTY